MVQEQHIHDERHQDQGIGKRDQVDYHLKVTAVTGVRDGEHDLSNFCPEQRVQQLQFLTDAPSIAGAFPLMQGAPHSKDSSCYHLQVVAYHKVPN